MFKPNTLRFALLTLALAIFVNLALSEVTFAKQRRGRGRFNDKKAEKFINGHDARDGRFDGRGPRFRFRDRRDRDEWRDDDRRWRGDDRRWRDDDRRWRDDDRRWRDDDWRNRRMPRRRRF
ncbi:MAG: hypothetical protein ACREAB_17865 [Blastocatellia bacterium]